MHVRSLNGTGSSEARLARHAIANREPEPGPSPPRSSDRVTPDQLAAAQRIEAYWLGHTLLQRRDDSIR